MHIDCKYAEESGKQGTVICTKGEYGTRIHKGVCNACRRGAVPPEDPCSYRGIPLKWVPCCGGKKRPVVYKCEYKKDVAIASNACGSKYCKHYRTKPGTKDGPPRFQA